MGKDFNDTKSVRFTISGQLCWIACLLGCVLHVTAGSALAQPSISSVSGTVSHGQTLSISGASFGTKGTAAPKVYTADSIPSIPGNLTDTSSSVMVAGQVTYNNQNSLRHPFEVSNVRWDFKLGTDGFAGGFFTYTGGVASNWFVQYWVKLDTNFHLGTGSYGQPDQGVANIKIFRLFPVGSRNYSNYGYAWHGFAGGDILRYVENDAPSTKYLGVDARDWLTPGTWHLLQFQTGEGSVGVANGSTKMWVDGVLRDSASIVTNASADGSAINKRPYIIGFFPSWGVAEQSSTHMYTFQGGVYVDDSWARVELGNASTYSGCTHREIQPPTIWSASSVAVKVNQGSFSSGAGAYLYLVDANGQVNSSGFPVTIGGGAASTPPAAPTNLRIVS